MNLQALMGAREAVELHTHHYLEGNVATGQLLPRLVGFLSAEERAFFLSFIKVPGISPKSGVRAMSLPPLQIAEAIATANAALLTKLPGIGRKKAEQVISTLREEIAELQFVGEIDVPPLEHRSPSQPLPCTGTSWPCWWGSWATERPRRRTSWNAPSPRWARKRRPRPSSQEVFRLSR